MSRMTISRLRLGRKTRRTLALLVIVVLCLTVVMVFAGAALATGGTTITLSNGHQIQTSEGMKAPSLNYKFVWWSFILTFGLLLVYYILILRLSDREFKKIIDAHFGPKKDGM
jgi:TRAP-type C4-dicarboxylate transport system permease small subunit